VQTISICAFHHDDVGGRWWCRCAQQRSTGIAQVTREEHPAPRPAISQLQQDAG